MPSFGTAAMLFVVQIFAFVDASVAPEVLAITALLHVVHKVAFVPAPVWPLEDAIAFHFIVEPRAFILSSIGPFHLSVSVEVIFDELSSVGPLVSVSVRAVSMHLILDVAALVRGTIRPSLATLSVSHTFPPISGVLAATFDLLSSGPVHQIIFESAVVGVLVDAYHSSLTVALIVHEVPDVNGSVWVNVLLVTLKNAGSSLQAPLDNVWSALLRHLSVLTGMTRLFLLLKHGSIKSNLSASLRLDALQILVFFPIVAFNRIFTIRFARGLFFEEIKCNYFVRSARFLCTLAIIRHVQSLFRRRTFSHGLAVDYLS